MYSVPLAVASRYEQGCDSRPGFSTRTPLSSANGPRAAFSRRTLSAFSSGTNSCHGSAPSVLRLVRDRLEPSGGQRFVSLQHLRRGGVTNDAGSLDNGANVATQLVV